MSNGFIRSVLSTQKQRQRFFWFRNVISLLCPLGVLHLFKDGYIPIPSSLDWLIWVLAFASIFIGYLTIAPIIAFAVCFLEHLFSWGK